MDREGNEQVLESVIIANLSQPSIIVRESNVLKMRLEREVGASEISNHGECYQ